MDFKERLTLGGASYTNWNPVQDFRIDSSSYCDSPVSYGQRLTTLIWQHDVAWWLWSIFDHTKQDCNNETMNQSWSPEQVSITKKIYIFTSRFKLTHRKGDLFFFVIGERVWDWKGLYRSIKSSYRFNSGFDGYLLWPTPFYWNTKVKFWTGASWKLGFVRLNGTRL